MDLFQITAIFLGVMALVGWINARTFALPQSVAMLAAGIAAAGLLFLLTGLQVFVIPFDFGEMRVWLCSIVLVALARLMVVVPWGAYFSLRHNERGASMILTLGGLRGGISLALAFTLPRGPPHDLIVATTFAVVIFSVLVQSLTLGPVIRRLTPDPAAA